LNQEPSARETQVIAVGVDPGSKKEGLTVKSEAHTYLNVQADATVHVKEAKKDQAEARRARRQRKTPCRQPRANRARGGIPPSTKARWQWKLRLVNWLRKMFPVVRVVIEDIKARTFKNGRKWNVQFSPLEVGKKWLYEEIEKVAYLDLYQGHETAEMRNDLGLKKISNKMAEVFEAHCVDSWTLTNAVVGGHTRPDNTDLILVTPLKLHRRELHRRQPAKGGIRSPYGGTRSEGFKRGSIVRHPKHGVAYVGGASDGRVSLHRMSDGKRLTQNAKPVDIHFLSYSSWRMAVPPHA
jgi:hypothetical protein